MIDYVQEKGESMILNKCSKGHYYDQDKFAACPYCALADNYVEQKTEDKSKGFTQTKSFMDSPKPKDASAFGKTEAMSGFGYE